MRSNYYQTRAERSLWAQIRFPNLSPCFISFIQFPFRIRSSLRSFMYVYELFLMLIRLFASKSSVVSRVFRVFCPHSHVGEWKRNELLQVGFFAVGTTNLDVNSARNRGNLVRSIRTKKRRAAIENAEEIKMGIADANSPHFRQLLLLDSNESR